MPVAATLLKFALFALWAHPTYKSTIEMLEIRERRLGLLPENAASTEAARRTAAKPLKSAPARKPRTTSQKQTRTT